MTRHDAREIALHIIFGIDFFDGTAEQLIAQRLSYGTFNQYSEDYALYAKTLPENQKDYISAVISGIFEHKAELDSLIEKYSVGWQLSRLSRITVAVLRLAFFECKYMDDVPPSAAINEAVELAKKYDDDEAPAFINGILGTFSRAELTSAE